MIYWVSRKQWRPAKSHQERSVLWNLPLTFDSVYFVKETSSLKSNVVVNRSICDNQDCNHINQPVSTIEQTTRTLNIFVCFKTVCNIWGSLTRRTRSVASCHSKATHKEHIHRDKIRFEIASRESSVMSYSEVGGGPLAFQTTLMRTLSCVSNNTLTRSHSYIFMETYTYHDNAV